ncbi:MAG: hypothetical protein IKB80_01055 [Oscillospiraceae bacterium]|nr:hypothetical protein [Oscillospiraceae bacterium]
MNTLQAGFARVNVTPPLGIPMRGYMFQRLAEGVLDELEINALALACGETKVVLMTLDAGAIETADVNVFIENVAEETGLPKEAIIIHAVHTHTAGSISFKSTNETVLHYTEFLRRRFRAAAKFALEDLKPAKMGWAVSHAPNVAFVRRFRMKDGSVRTNPGVGNPDILHPIGDVDERVNVLRFDREGAETIVLGNMGNHPDCIGGLKFSADWPGFFRRTLEKSLDNVKAIFFNGCEGDLNHVNVNAKGGQLNHLHFDFDGPRGYQFSRHVGNVMASAAMQVYEVVNYVDVDSLRFARKTIQMPSNMPTPEEMPMARKYFELHKEGRDDEIPFEGMELTTIIADSKRKIRLENGPEYFSLSLSAVSIGNVALIGYPAEPFNAVGVGVKEAEGWDMVMPTCMTNGREGYFPTKDAYDEGGYEAKASNYKAGAAEQLIREGKDLLATLR